MEPIQFRNETGSQASKEAYMKEWMTQHPVEEEPAYDPMDGTAETLDKYRMMLKKTKEAQGNGL